MNTDDTPETAKLKTDAAQKKVDIHDNHSWLLGDSAGYPVVLMRGRGG
jgi:hypothetical protein